jgi:antitoxin CptB
MGSDESVIDGDRDLILKRLGFRAWHRGTREADYLIGGFFDAYAADWTAAELAWFETLLAEEDVDIMAWAMDRDTVPERHDGPLMAAMRKLDYVPLPGTPASRAR